MRTVENTDFVGFVAIFESRVVTIRTPEILFGQSKETVRVDTTKGVELSTVDAPRQPRAVILALEDVFVGV